ncbi:MAG: hypothetical protein IH787_04340 [Nitrospirae bacterium]|nr:hypothetical protein [Nitrospirota bacterium]
MMFYILTGGGTRLKPLRFARTDQFADGVWIIEGEALKGTKGKVSDFRVPVTGEMQRLVEMSIAASKYRLLFPSPRARQGRAMAISDQAIENIMRSREQEWDWPERW